MASAYGRLPLNALRVFEAVATRLSFAEAAEALNVTPAAVSQQIRTLEDYLQMPLLRRSGRKVELTAEGARLLPGVRRGLDQLTASLQELRQLRLGGTLKVSTLASVLQRWLLPRIGRLHERQGDLQVEWHTSTRPVDFARSDFHAAIRLGSGGYEGLEAHKLFDEQLVAVATPGLLAEHGSLDGYDDLDGLPLLHSRDEPWSDFTRKGQGPTRKAGPTMIDDSASILAAAANGLGFALTRWSLVEQDVGRGELVLASRRVVPTGWALWLVYPEAYAGLPKLAHLKAWLLEEAAAFRPRPGGESPGGGPAGSGGGKR